LVINGTGQVLATITPAVCTSLNHIDWSNNQVQSTRNVEYVVQFFISLIPLMPSVRSRASNIVRYIMFIYT